MYKDNIKCPRCEKHKVMYKERSSNNEAKRTLLTAAAVILFIIGIAVLSLFHFLGITCMALAVALGKSLPASEKKTKRIYKCQECGYKWEDFN